MGDVRSDSFVKAKGAMAAANGEGWAALPWAPSPMAGVERRLLDRLGAAGAINFAAIGETRQQGQGSATDAPRLGRCKGQARPLRAICNSLPD